MINDDLRVDLHLHTTQSDGTYSPGELVRYAVRKNIGAIAITDHDTVTGIKEAQEVADQLDIMLLHGIEISAIYRGDGALHILGYGIDTCFPGLLEKLSYSQERRRNRNVEIVEKLQDMGIDISYDEIMNENSEVGIIGRPHIATALINKGVVTNMKQAFAQYLSNSGPAFVSKEIFTPEESIKMILDAGGKAFLAHPTTLHINGEKFDEYLQVLKGFGLNGVEVYSAAHNRTQIKNYRQACQNMDLMVSAGSDFHGSNKPKVGIGICNNGKRVKMKDISSDLFEGLCH